ncbi:MAG: hypothetical protein KC620_05490 [Myxococcales bacterium]|nr:hypothetical protein [Myxococcales bacterium]
MTPELPLHPGLVHLPLGIGLILPIVLFWLWFYVRKSPDRARIWWLGVALQAMVTATSFAAMQTGEADEHKVEKVVAKAKIHAHEEAAELFAYASVAGLVVTVAGSFVAPARLVAALLSIVIIGFGLRAGEKGGELVYIHGAADAHRSGAPPPTPGAAEDHD